MIRRHTSVSLGDTNKNQNEIVVASTPTTTTAPPIPSHKVSTPTTTPTATETPSQAPVVSYEEFVGTGTSTPTGTGTSTGTGTASNAYQAGVGLIGSNYTTAVNAANTNKQLGMNYAQGVKHSAYGSAENLRQQTDANTEIARQRGIIDSNSSYQRAVGAYGSNAETLAGRGLSGSGYGEYLTADAYATHRGQVQSINADALKANRESAYLEAQAKAAADSEYLKNIYGIESEYNNAMTTAETEKTKGLYELGVGLDTARDEAYTSLIDAAARGTSLEIIKQSGAWGDLTPEQQNAIISESNKVSNTNTVQDMIDSGDSVEEIKSGDEYKNLEPETKEKVDKILNQREEHEENYLKYVSEEASGMESATDLESFLNTYTDEDGNLLSNDMREKITKKWVDDNVADTMNDIKNAKVVDGQLVYNGQKISADLISLAVKNGMYGDNAKSVVEAFAKTLLANVPQNASSLIHNNYYMAMYIQLKVLGDIGEKWAIRARSYLDNETAAEIDEWYKNKK